MKLLDSDKRGKMSLRKFFMEKSLGPEETWPNYDLMNGRILPSNLTLQQQIPPKEIVKRRNGLFIVDADGGNVQCVQKKRTTYFQTAVTPFRIVEIKKVRRDLERARVDLSNAYNYFPVTQ